MNDEQAARYIEAFRPEGHTAEQVEQFKRRCSQDFDSWVRVDDRLFEGVDPKSKPHLLFFSSCHNQQIHYYIRDWRPEVYDRFFVNYLMIHQCQLQPDISINPLTMALVGSASVIVSNNFAPKFGQFSMDNILRYAVGDPKHITFVPPTSACWWPCCFPFGEDGVIFHMQKEGLEAEGIIRKFRRGSFMPCFKQRFREQMDNLRLREKRHMVTISDFVVRNHRKAKMFSSFNHPCLPVIGHIVEQVLGRFGYTVRPEEHSLALPPTGGRIGNHYCETLYEWEFYNFQYPMRYVHDRGGPMAFYPDEIRKSYAKQKALMDAGKKDFINPEDDL